MAKNPNVLTCGRGIDLDSDPVNQTPNTRRFTLNGLSSTIKGKKGYLGIDLSNYATTEFPLGYYPIGDEYIGDNNKIVILNNPTTSKTQIGIVDKAHKYTTIVDTGTLATQITHQCDIIFRLRRGNQRVIYWVDALNFARSFNIDKVYNYYNDAYKLWIRNGGDPNTFVGDKWDGSAFNLIKTYNSIPAFNNVEILESGAILPGSYNFAIQYVDEDLNPTNWVTTSNTVNIYNDTTTTNYDRIRGSRNVQTDSQSFARTSKSIKLTIGNLDQSFPYYRIAIIRAASNNGQPDAVLISDLSSVFESIFLYTGNDSALAQGSLEEILIDNEVIFAPHHIEQLENRCILAYTSGKGVNWCDFQQYASKISSDLTTKEVLLNSIISDPNVKNAKSTFLYKGYMPGEVYSFGIVYVFDDGTISPTFHIPGKNENVVNDMKYHEINNVYLNVHNCAESGYWARDAYGETLTAKNTRHHRFPFRKEVNKPLVTTSTNSVPVTRYRLRITISINPAHTPTPEYPNDGVDPLVIGYTINYKVEDAPGASDFSGQLTDSDIDTEILVYDDVNALEEISPGIMAEVDSGSELASYVAPTANPNLIFTYNYDSYVLTSIDNVDISEIFGIEFSNIEKPHPNVIGFYIVRNERKEEDRIIVDNAFFGPMTEFNQYKSFGLINPKQYYPATNCAFGTQNPTKTLSYFKRGTWFFNPEFQYFNKRTEFDGIEIEGKYEQTSVNMPTIGENDTECLLGGAKGVVIQDVQAGTSFNPDVNNGSDSDGFDMIIGYRNTNTQFALDTGIVLPAKDRILYLNAASSQNYINNTYYNVSVDNKIGMFLTQTDIDTEEMHETGSNENHLLYGALVKNNTASYSNFMTRPYYKEHNNLIEFGNNNILNNVKIFNGDAEISAMNFVSSVYYDMVVADRDKKNKVWQIIAGAVLVVVGVILTVYGVGIGLTAAGAALLGGLAISYGVSVAMAGIKFEEFKKMVNVDYTKGLKDTVTDGGVFETLRENLSDGDDTIRWFADRASNIYIESAVPFGLRAGLTSGVTDFVDAPAPYDEFTFREYLVNKLTVIDREQGSGRLYKGYATAEVYDMNLDYMRFNYEKIFTHLPLEYDCCSDAEEVFPTRVRYSEQSFQEERVDNYRAFLPNNYSDIEGIHGSITDLYRLGNSLFLQTEEALWQLPQSQQERVTSEIVSFIGTGQFFSIPPRKVIDDDMGSAGTKHKWATIKTKLGVVSLSEIEHKVTLHGERLEHLKQGLDSEFNEKLRAFLVNQVFDLLGVNFLNDNNPANPNGIGYLIAYDTRFERILLTKRDYLLLPDKVELLTLVETKPVSGTAFAYCTEDGRFYQGTTAIELNNDIYFEDKSFTVSYSFEDRMWTSWHSFIPNYYITGKGDFYSFVGTNNFLWKHNKERGEARFRTYYGITYPYIVELTLSRLIETSILKDIELQTTALELNEDTNEEVVVNDLTFNKVIAYNSRQSTGEQEITITAKDANYLLNRIKKQVGKIKITKNKRDWNLNEFKDMVVDYEETLFTTDWLATKTIYPIDKVVNPLAIDQTKVWHELQNLQDKYVIFRFKLDLFANVNLIMYFTIPSEQPSI